MTAASFLALGDSYTIGEAVEEAGRWPVQLANMLRGAGRAITDPRIIARTGWTTDELSAAIAEARGIDGAVDGPHTLVSLLIGVNDQYRGGTADAYRPRFAALLEQAIGFAGGKPSRVIVLSIPDWGVTPFADGRDRATIARAIDAYNAAAQVAATVAGARWVDVTRASREPRADWLAADGLHPSAAQYAEWARLALPAAQAALAG